MMTVNEYFKCAGLNWQAAWKNKNFRYKLYAGIGLFIIILVCYPFFFQYIEKRKGHSFNDILLSWIPAYDVYYPIFILVWSNVLIMLIAAIRKPPVLLLFLIAYVLLSIIRALCIFLIPLQTPPGIISLIDPLANHFYGVPFITKDLFFSGHASTLFLIFLCQKNKPAEYYAFISSICVGVLVLVQHIHYSIDVLFAFPFAYLCYRTAKYITKTRQ